MQLYLILLLSIFYSANAFFEREFTEFIKNQIAENVNKDIVLKGSGPNSETLTLEHFTRTDLKDSKYEVVKCTTVQSDIKDKIKDIKCDNVPLANVTNLISFGGREDLSEQYGDRRPVVLVHGQGTYAGQLYLIREELLKVGYKSSEIFSTTVGESAGVRRTLLEGSIIRRTGTFYGHDQELPRGPMICLYMRKLRKFIEYVWEYTKSHWKGDKTNYKIDIIGESMGVLTSRKAILGGKCVDDLNIDLGPPLTDKVHTYIGAAGPNNGSHLCTGLGKSDTVGKITTRALPGCNLVTGFRPDSTFMKDINLIEPAGNRRTPPVTHGYEGHLRFSFMSFTDECVGYNTLGGMGFGRCDIIQDNEKEFTDHENFPHKRSKHIAWMLAYSETVKDTCSKAPKLKNDTSKLLPHLKVPPLSHTLGYSEYTDISEVIAKLDKIVPTNNVANNAPAALNKNGLGDICVSLKYCRITKALTVIIVEAKSLKKMDVRGLADPYVKLYLHEGTKPPIKKKTSTKSNTLDPHYLESFDFVIEPEKMENVYLMLSLWDKDKGSRDEIIGDVVLASDKLKIDSVPVAGHEQWSEMMRTGRTAPVHCYSLVGRK